MQDKVTLAHGGGGALTSDWIKDAILSRFSNPILDRLDDAAILRMEGERIAFTTDSYVVTPRVFPGGTIGDLAVCGTVNDLAMCGALPRALSLALILEEGIPFGEVETILDAIQTRATQAGVQIVTGDTKVVGRGQGDGIYINTAGIGLVPPGVDTGSNNAAPGDVILLSGALGLHGLAVMLARESLGLSTPVESDVAPLNHVVKNLMDAGIRIHCLRDLTRGGLAAAAQDIATASSVTLTLNEADFPVHPAQASACEVLGLDPIAIACEGRFMAIVDPADAEKALEIIQSDPAGREAAIAGTVMDRATAPVELVTPIGTRRVVTMPRGEQMPRIC